MTELCDIGFKYKTDKCPQIKHHFTEFYHDMFKDKRETVKKVVEIGIGNMSPYYVIGASLLMWREYFPNAQIYGADIDPITLFQSDRISTIYCDQTKKENLEALIKFTGDDVDLFIDDGLHTLESQIFTCLSVMPLLKNAVYVIEDAAHANEIIKSLGEYDCRILRRSRIKYRDDRLVVVRHGVF